MRNEVDVLKVGIFVMTILFGEMLYQTHGIKCYTCTNYPDFYYYDPNCGNQDYHNENFIGEDTTEGLSCFTQQYEDGTVVRFLWQYPGDDKECERYPNSIVPIQCFCKDDLCNTNLCTERCPALKCYNCANLWGEPGYHWDPNCTTAYYNNTEFIEEDEHQTLGAKCYIRYRNGHIVLRKLWTRGHDDRCKSVIDEDQNQIDCWCEQDLCNNNRCEWCKPQHTIPLNITHELARVFNSTYNHKWSTEGVLLLKIYT